MVVTGTMVVTGSDIFVDENKKENENYDPFVHENERLAKTNNI